MKIVKRATQPWVPPGGDDKHKKLCHPYESHPSWIVGMENLNSYGEWVSEVLIPIVFKWIEEHKAEVYASVADENKDDVGVVVASAYEIVKASAIYAQWVEASKAFDEDERNGTIDYKTINPVWAKVVKRVRENTHRVFEDEAGVLRGTIRTIKP